MKRLKYAVILLLGLSMATTMMTSCTKDKAQSIIGEWEVISATYISNGEPLYDYTDEYGGLVYTFNEKTTNFPDYLPYFTYEINDNILTVTNDGSYTIVELTSSSLILEGLEGSNMRYVFKRV